MIDYRLEIKQMVEYPRCRIYRPFIRTLMEDRSIRVSGGSGLFCFSVLCSYANYRTSYKRIGGINYTIYPGEWICTVKELSSWFRTRFQKQALGILDTLNLQGYITYSLLNRGKLVKFSIKGWRHFNKILDYNAPCAKDTGFFFLPIDKANELVSIGKCSEMDILLDLWINTVYNDEQVDGSDLGPVVYMRNGTSSPLLSYAELSERWGTSKATTSRIIKKLGERKYLSVIAFPGRHGSVIYLQSYLSTMFSISDVMVDKEEVGLVLNIQVKENDQTDADLTPDHLIVSEELNSVSKTVIHQLVNQVSKILLSQGISCVQCSRIRYMLSQLSNCGDGKLINKASSRKRMLLKILCASEEIMAFEIVLKEKGDSYENSEK